MDTPSSLFLDMPGIDGAFSGDKGAPTLDQSFPMFAESVVKRGVPFTSSKMKMVRGLGGWGDATEEATEAADTDVLQTKATFVRPTGLFTETDSNASMTLPTRSSRTPSVAPELIPRTTRLSTSRKTTSSLSSDTSGSSGSLTSAATDITEPDHEPPKKRTRATRKVKKEAAEDDMRNKFLERNRVAASKCREKKKEFVSKLEETKITLERKHTQLQVEYNALITEVGGLKHDLMTHAKCNDANIDKWIANEARKFVQTSDIFGHRAAAAVAAQHDNPFVHAHTRHSSATSSVQPHGLGSFSSASARRDSMAYSQASSVHTSPTALAFPTLASPKFDRDMTSMNFDHMPDDMFDAEP